MFGSVDLNRELISTTPTARIFGENYRIYFRQEKGLFLPRYASIAENHAVLNFYERSSSLIDSNNYAENSDNAEQCYRKIIKKIRNFFLVAQPNAEELRDKYQEENKSNRSLIGIFPEA